jgi:hypothetical protein
MNDSMSEFPCIANKTDVVDKDGRSILHYSMLMPLDKDGRVRQRKIEEDGTTWSIFVVCLDFKHNFHLTDHEGRNFLHYAAKSGNYHGFDYTAQLLSDKDLGLLLKKKDKMGKTPLDEAFYSLPKHETLAYVFKIKIGYTLDLCIAVNNISVILYSENPPCLLRYKAIVQITIS